MPALIEARQLTKQFGEFTAVDAIDFAVEDGESFGFLGPNGAGKTSTMRMIGAVSPVSSGSLSVLGLDPEHQGPQLRARLGVVPQEDNLDQELTVYDNLMMYGRYFDLSRAVIKERIEELLDFVQLADKRKSKVDALSGGMKRRLTIARGLINEPDLLILDEPTTGLDPQARHVLWDRLYRLKQQGVTLIITTHYMDEAEQLCDRLVIMDKAKIVAEGSPRALIEEYAGRESSRFGSHPASSNRSRNASRRLPLAARSSPIAPCSTPTMPKTPSHVSPRPDSLPRRFSLGAHPSRTSSSASPGARSSTDGNTARTARLRIRGEGLPTNVESVGRLDIPQPDSLPRGNGSGPRLAR
jgi:lipooligosaccharide transport system ATP-binding protein